MGIENTEKLEQIPQVEDSEKGIEPISEGGIEKPTVPFEEIQEDNKNIESINKISEFNEWYNPNIEQTEIVTDLEMTEGIADYLETVEELKYENWSKLSLEQRQEVLNIVEHKIAEIEHRPALRVEVENMRPHDLGYQNWGQQKIALNTQYVVSNDPNVHREILSTIIHEGRHAYQHYNVEVKCIHESVSEVKTWEKNFFDPEMGYYRYDGQKIWVRYGDGSIHDAGFKLYADQPVETDARNFTSDVLVRLEERGYIKPEQESFATIKGEGHSEGNIEMYYCSPYESGFDMEHPMPSYAELRNAGFSHHVASQIIYGVHSYSDKELFHVLYEADDPVKAYNEMVGSKARAAMDKTDKLIKDIEKEYGFRV